MAVQAKRLSTRFTGASSFQLDWRVTGAVLFTVVFWASAFAGIRIGLRDYAPETLALLRYITASTVLLGFALARRMPLPKRRDLPQLLFIGFLSISLYNVALNAGEEDVTAGVASMIIASAPIWVALLSVLFLKERLRAWGWLGITLCFTGVAVIAMSGHDGFKLSFGALLILVAAVAHSVSIILQKPLLRRYSALQLVTYMIWGGTLILLVFLPNTIRDVQKADAESTLAVIYMGIFPGALAYATWFYVLSKLPASIAASFLYLIPVLATGMAWGILGEIPTVLAIIGGILVLGGVILVNTWGRVKAPLTAPLTKV